MLNLYSVGYFDSVSWRWERKEMLAEDIDQVREFVDVLCKPEFRGRPYTEKHSDSLTVTFLKEIKLPHITMEL